MSAGGRFSRCFEIKSNTMSYPHITRQNISVGLISRILVEKSREESVFKEEALSENRKKGKTSVCLSHLKPTNEIFIAV